MKRLLLAIAFLLTASAARGADIYFAPVATGTGAGSSCANARGVSSHAIGDDVPDNILHLCGSLSGAAGANVLTMLASGTSGHNITIKFEAGSSCSSVVFGTNGCISTGNKQFITIDGGGTGSVPLSTFVPVGIIQNTDNGDAKGHKVITTLLNMTQCNGCILKNIVLANAYVAVKNTPAPIGGPATQMNAVVISGSNWRITNSVIHDCGWCILTNYGNGDTNVEVDNNDIYNWDHGMMFATSGANAFDLLKFHDNKVHDNVNWEDTIAGGSNSDCPYHLDGVHFFGSTGSTMDRIYVYNNWWYGALSGPCSSGFLFAESVNSSTPAHILRRGTWNNVFDATNSTSVFIQVVQGVVGNTNGWDGMFSGQTSALVANNTMLFKHVNDGTNCYNEGSTNNLTFKNNVVNGCVIAGNIGSLTSTPVGQINNNFYGSACDLSNNCFIQNGAFKGSFTNWKVIGWDTNSAVSTFSGALLNADGSPQAGSPIIALGANLSATAVGDFATLAFTTTKGGTLTPVARPGVAAWDAGAYQFSGAVTAPNVTFSPNPVAFGNQNINTSSTPINVTVANVGNATETYSSLLSNSSEFVNGNTGLAGQCAASGTIAAGSSCVVKITFTPTVATARSGTLTITGTQNASVAMTGTGTNAISIPSIPTGLTAVASGSNINLSWTASTGTPTSYRVSRGTVSGGPYTQIATPTTTSYSDTGLAAGTYFYVVAATNSAGTSANSTQASATVISLVSAATLSPASLLFGSVVQGVASNARVVTVTSSGTSNLILASSNAVSISGPNAADFAISGATCTNSLSIVPGNSCTVNVTFTPSTTTAETASLIIASNDPASPDTITLSGTGVTPVVVSPTSINFGNVYRNKTSAPQVVTYTNQSGASITFSSVAITGGDNTQFTLGANTCTGTLTDGNSCTVSLTFTPTTPGQKSSALVITDNSTGSPRSVTLTGKSNTHKVLKVGAVVKYQLPSGFQIIQTVWRGKHNQTKEII